MLQLIMPTQCWNRFLNEEEGAPFDGRLMNDEAVANIIVGKEMSVEQCEIQKELVFSTNKSGTTTGNRLFKSRVGNRKGKERNSIGDPRSRDRVSPEAK